MAKKTALKGHGAMKKEPRAKADIMNSKPAKHGTRGAGGPIGQNAKGSVSHNINQAQDYNTMPAGYKRGSCG